MRQLLGVLLLFAIPSLSYSWPENVPYPEFQGDILPYRTLVNGRWVQARVREGCSSTPVTIFRKRYRNESWNNQYRGGSSSSSSWSDTGRNSGRSVDRWGSDSRSESWRAGGSASASDWHNNRETGQLINDDVDSMTFYPCGQVQQ